MKNFLFLVVLIILSLAYACSDQDIDIDDELEHRSSVAYAAGADGVYLNPNCDIFPELCPYPHIYEPGPSGPGVPGGPGGPSGPTDVLSVTGGGNPPTQIVFRTQSKDITVQAVGHPKVSREFSVVTDDGVFVIAEVSSEEESTYTESVYRIPNCIYKVFDMDYSSLYDGVVSAEDMSELYDGREIGTEGENSRIVINITGDEINDCKPPVYTIKTFDWCERKPAITAHAWMRNMMTGINTNGWTYSVMWAGINRAAMDCYEGLACTDCIDPKCILDRVNFNPNVNQTLRNNYEALVDEKLNDIYDIGPGTVNTTSLEVKEFLLKEDCEPTVMATCGEDINKQDFLDALSRGNPSTVDELISEIGTENDIIILTKAFKECSSLLCVYNVLKNNNSDLFCSTIDEGFISNPLSDLELDVSHHVNNVVFYFDKFASAAGEASAVTSAIDGSDVTIVFNEDRCSDGYTSIEFVRTLMHEAIHAKMFSDCWPEGASYDEYRKGFLECLQEHYLLELGDLPEEEQHIAMSNIFVQDIAEAINQYLGGNGSWEDYEYLAWYGLSQYPDYSNEQWFQDHLQVAKQRYENNTLPINDPCDN